MSSRLPHESPPPPAMADGAAARKAARAVTSLRGARTPAAEPAPREGPMLDPGVLVREHVGSLASELRRVEQYLARRVREELKRPHGASDPSLLEQVARFIDPATYQRWIAAWRMRDRSDVVDEFGLDPVYAETWQPLLEFLYRTYWRVEAIGLDNLPARGRALVVANHSGTLPSDGAMLMYAVRFAHPAHRHIRPLVEDFVFHFPYLGVALNRLGCVRACQENAERLLDANQVVAVFPEGVKGIGKLYRQRYQLQRFGRGGFIKLALKTRTPIIPTAVIGAEETYPMLLKLTWLAKRVGVPYLPITPTFPWLGPAGAIPLPSKWTLRFGEPMDFVARYGADAHHDRMLVNQLTEQVRSAIQSMVDETLRGRRSIIFG